MARPLRIEYPGAVYHVTSRGNARQAIYKNDGDRYSFLEILEKVVVRYHWLCYAYCLMDNHYHLLMETPEGNLSSGMRQLNGVYTQRFNRHHGRSGHVLQGRFKAILVERDSYLLELCRYVVLNPVRAGVVRLPEQFPWSSYRATAGLEEAPAFLVRDWVLGQFGRQRRRAEEAYRAFVKVGIGGASPWEGLQGQCILGSAGFMEKLKPLLARKADVKEIPRIERFADRPSLEKVLSGGWKGKAQRDQAIRRVHLQYGYTLTEIGQHLGMHYTTISKIVNGR